MKIALVDNRISNEEKNNLEKRNIKVILCPSTSLLYPAVCGHPDMLLHIIDNKNIILHKNIDKKFVESLKNLEINIILSNNSLRDKYPKDIILNALNIGNIFMHKLNYTDPNLISLVNHKKLLNINQGYAKCSTAIVSENAVMTSDMKIGKILKENNIDVLLLPPGDIILPSLDYGFIGGTCGLLDNNTLAFYGDLDMYKYGNEVLSFLRKHNVEPIFLSKSKLIDRGSIFCIDIN
ncbi:Uncharacterised protein [Clostridium sporogenes]|uniref:DUF6873 domain-containing protein n=1 Tax=Clostridium sporogenes TaxID=1509 RepID=A0A7U4LPD1_CLOSG|nr:hypothetical protein [Clostridium sporogenes]AKC63958.1 hypothetical protein CLSPO_c32400 [Clostridium sporogenes]AKJ91097.1 hypothetical protein CLSPOx_16220 [Clostridium sporogenes]KCZ66872.1 hypothetical protein CSPO_10c00150 [Clostridium sporogenes]OOO64670.1 hypothetical protein BS099_17760 [Clostridium sporogenes]SQB89523.1 Uncharacterised protein [Clostridium sporogenes]